MQFRETGRKYQALAYRGYDVEKKHAIVRKIGTLDRFSYQLTPSTEYPPSVEELKEIEEWVNKQKEQTAKLSTKWEVRNFPTTLQTYIRAISESPELLENTDVSAIIAELDDLKKKLKPLIKKVTTKPKKANPTKKTKAKAKAKAKSRPQKR